MANTAAVGPWTGGLNLTSNRDLSPYLANNELGIATNVQLTREGFIESRPGFKTLEHSINVGTVNNIKILGSIYMSDQEIVVIQVRTASNTLIYYLDGNKVMYLKATMSLSLDFSSVLALNNSASTLTTETPRGVFLFDSLNKNACYRLEAIPSTSAATPVLMSSVLSVPRSHFSFSVRDRVFLIDAVSSTLYWSALATNSLFFDSAELSGGNPTARGKETGDIQTEPSLDATDNINSVEFINNSFYLFKKTDTFLFTYQSDPESDGYLRKISAELGAFDSTVFRNAVIVINNRGVFSVEGTQFLDLQSKLNLRFEQYLDTVTPRAFVTDFNGNILVGYTSSGTDYYYMLNGVNQGWTQWDFNYAAPDVLAAPGSNAYAARTATDQGILAFTSMDKKRLIYAHWKPNLMFSPDYDYALDTPKDTQIATGKDYKYVPTINIQSRTLLGDSVLNFKKLYRYYIRFYLSDIVSAIANNSWDFSVNYNNYKFAPTFNPKFQLLIVAGEGTPDPYKGAGIPLIDIDSRAATVNTEVYKRTYQIPIHQQRAKEFTFQLIRPFSKLDGITLNNANADRPVHQGFYFLLSGLWIDYEDKVRL